MEDITESDGGDYSVGAGGREDGGGASRSIQ
jgi:hypothetical protein